MLFEIFDIFSNYKTCQTHSKSDILIDFTIKSIEYEFNEMFDWNIGETQRLPAFQ